MKDITYSLDEIIEIIKEITDSISIVMKLVTLGKSLFSGD